MNEKGKLNEAIKDLKLKNEYLNDIGKYSTSNLGREYMKNIEEKVNCS